MGNFLVVVPATGAEREGETLFREALRAAREIRGQAAAKTIESDWAYAASFARLNGSGGKLVSDPATGSWLLAIGTWFHQDGYASGAELKLLRRYLELDAARLGRELEGFFVVVIGDARTREVVVLTDVAGSCHCFRRTLAAGLVLSGSSLLLASLQDCKLDLTACQEFLDTGIIYEDRSCYQEVRKLGPASAFRFSGDRGENAQQYWRAADLKLDSLHGEGAVDQLWDGLTRAAKRIAGLYRRPICDLTGGYDSRALVAAFVGAEVRCTTTVSGPADSADVVISRGLAQMLGLAHIHTGPLRGYSFDGVRRSLAITDGEYDLLKYTEIREIHGGLAEKFDISINGSFGEIARGYWWELLFPRIGARERLDAGKLARRRYAAVRGDGSIYAAKDRLDLAEHFSGVIERTNAGLSDSPNTFQMDHAYLMMRMQRWQGRIASSTNQLWPCLSSFMFRSILETMLQTRALLRWRSLLIRKMLAKYSPRMANYRLEHGFPATPARWNNFYRFLPLAGYFGGKVLGKVGGKMGLRKSATNGDDEDNARMQLWREERVREMLRPADMKIGAWVDVEGLGRFLARSEEGLFPFGEQWARLLSLESALQAAARARKRLREEPAMGSAS